MLIVLALETFAFFLGNRNIPVPPEIVLALVRSLDIIVLLAWGKWSIPTPFGSVLRETLFFCAVLTLAGLLVLAAWKVLFGHPLMKVGLSPASSGKPALWAYYVTACTLSPVAEELLFRGILYRRAREWTGIAFSATAVVLIFASLHLHFTGQFMVPLLGGIIFCLAYEKTKSIFTPVFLHVFGNIVIYTIPLLGLA